MRRGGDVSPIATSDVMCWWMTHEVGSVRVCKWRNGARARVAGIISTDGFCSIEQISTDMAQRTTRIVSDDVLGGEPRIESTRIGVLQIFEEVEDGDLSPQAFADRYDLDVAAVYRALAHYHEHPQEMETVRQRRRQMIDDARDEAITPEDVE